jgi:pyruvate formate lyase activating enzyme
MFWKPLDGGRVRCTTCPSACERGEGGITQCRTRICRGGRLYSLTYGKPCVINEDPLAKNPLYHVDPGAGAIGAATAGCNLTCNYCQNWDISQVGPSQTSNIDVSPAELVSKAAERGLKWITFSYTEPVAYIEYAIDAAAIARKRGIRVAAATAGYISQDALAALIQHVDAFSFTLKGYSADFYREVCGCRIEEVHRAITAIAKSGKWLEAVTLIIPGLNDSEEGLRSIARLLVNLNRNIPLHFLRFAPAYKMKNLPPTPLATLEKAREAAVAEGLRFVYLDVPGHRWANTYCPRCQKPVIERYGFTVIANRLRRKSCPYCNAPIPGLAAG